MQWQLQRPAVRRKFVQLSCLWGRDVDGTGAAGRGRPSHLTEVVLGHEEITTHRDGIGRHVAARGAGIGYGERHTDTNFPSGADDDAQWYDTGLSFASAPWAVSGVDAHLERDSAVAIVLPRQEWDLWPVTSNHRLAPGLSLHGGVTVASLDDISPNPNFASGTDDVTSFSIGTTASF